MTILNLQGNWHIKSILDCKKYKARSCFLLGWSKEASLKLCFRSRNSNSKLSYVYCKSDSHGFVLHVFFLQWIYIAMIILDLTLRIVVLPRVIKVRLISLILLWCQIPNTVNPAKKTVLVMTVVHLNIVLPVIVIVLVLVAKMMSRKSKSQKIMSQKVQKMMIPGIDAVTGPLNNNSTSQFVEGKVF